MSRRQGDIIEHQALNYLQQQGLTLIERNFHSHRGEIDLIMKDGSTLAFIEVRYRKQTRFGSSAESVDWRKQQRLVATAQRFLQCHKALQDSPCRFDVIACAPGTDTLAINWIKNAFESHGY